MGLEKHTLYKKKICPIILLVIEFDFQSVSGWEIPKEAKWKTNKQVLYKLNLCEWEKFNLNIKKDFDTSEVTEIDIVKIMYKNLNNTI